MSVIKLLYSEYQKAEELYENELSVSAEELYPIFKRVAEILQEMGSTEGLGFLRKVSQTSINPKTVCDYDLPLNLLEFCLEVLEWSSARPLIEDLFFQQKSPGIRLKVEVLMRRFFEPNWADGDCKFIKLEPTVWSCLRKEESC